MKEKTLLILGFIIFMIGYHAVFDRFSYQTKYEKSTEKINSIHEQNHILRKDSVIKQRYFEQVYSDEFTPCSVSLECDLIK